MFWDTQAAKVGGGGMGCEPNCVSHLCLLPPSAWGVWGGAVAMATDGAMAGKSLRGHRAQLSPGKKTAPTQKPPEP